MTRGYIQVIEGAWYEPKRRGFIDQCCECGLTHVTDFAVVDRDGNDVPGVTVQFKRRIDHRKTSASRRKLKFAKDE